MAAVARAWEGSCSRALEPRVALPCSRCVQCTGRPSPEPEVPELGFLPQPDGIPSWAGKLRPIPMELCGPDRAPLVPLGTTAHLLQSASAESWGSPHSLHIPHSPPAAAFPRAQPVLPACGASTNATQIIPQSAKSWSSVPQCCPHPGWPFPPNPGPGLPSPGGQCLPSTRCCPKPAGPSHSW